MVVIFARMIIVALGSDHDKLRTNWLWNFGSTLVHLRQSYHFLVFWWKLLLTLGSFSHRLHERRNSLRLLFFQRLKRKYLRQALVVDFVFVFWHVVEEIYVVFQIPIRFTINLTLNLFIPGQGILLRRLRIERIDSSL